MSAVMDRPAGGKRLLLIDDDKALRQSLVEQLRLVAAELQSLEKQKRR